MTREADQRRPEGVSRFHEAIEAELRHVLAERGEPLYRMMEYQLGWIDEHGEPRSAPEAPRVLPALCLTLCEALGGSVATATPPAAAVELVSLFSQVHDDIQDGRPTRGGQPSVWWVWGPAQAINAGDGLHALARLSLFRMAERGSSLDAVLEATRTLDRACLELFEGQHMALRFQEQMAVTREAYTRMVERRAGALPGCAAELAALVAGADASVREACSLAGHRIGTAMQIRADINDLWERDPRDEQAGDALNRAALPFIHALEVAPVSVKHELGTLSMKRVLEPGDAPRVTELLDGVGAREACAARADQALREALDALAAARIPPGALDEILGAMDLVT